MSYYIKWCFSIRSYIPIQTSCFHTSASHNVPRGVSNRGERRTIEDRYKGMIGSGMDEMGSDKDMKNYVESMTNHNLEHLQEQTATASEHIKRDRKARRFLNMMRKNSPKFNEPNLLTWEMKVKLKNLHFTLPSVWTALTLSEAFPISEKGVSLLLKSRWKPETEDQILTHDAQVVEQWKQLTDRKFGNSQLLKSSIVKRFQRMTMSKLPAEVPIGTSDDVFQTLKDLQFTGEDDLFDPAEEHMKRIKRKKVLGESFKSIITDYEDKVNKKKAFNEYKGNVIYHSKKVGREVEIRGPQDAMDKCKNLMEIVPDLNKDAVNPNDVKIKTESNRQEPDKRDKYRDKSITYDEFMSKKSKR